MRALKEMQLRTPVIIDVALQTGCPRSRHRHRRRRTGREPEQLRHRKAKEQQPHQTEAREAWRHHLHRTGKALCLPHHQRYLHLRMRLHRPLPASRARTGSWHRFGISLGRRTCKAAYLGLLPHRPALYHHLRRAYRGRIDNWPRCGTDLWQRSDREASRYHPLLLLLLHHRLLRQRELALEQWLHLQRDLALGQLLPQRETEPGQPLRPRRVTAQEPQRHRKETAQELRRPHQRGTVLGRRHLPRKSSGRKPLHQPRMDSALLLRPRPQRATAPERQVRLRRREWVSELWRLPQMGWGPEPHPSRQTGWARVRRLLHRRGSAVELLRQRGSAMEPLQQLHLRQRGSRLGQLPLHRRGSGMQQPHRLHRRGSVTPSAAAVAAAEAVVEAGVVPLRMDLVLHPCHSRWRHQMDLGQQRRHLRTARGQPRRPLEQEHCCRRAPHARTGNWHRSDTSPGQRTCMAVCPWLLHLRPAAERHLDQTRLEEVLRRQRRGPAEEGVAEPPEEEPYCPDRFPRPRRSTQAPPPGARSSGIPRIRPPAPS
mmetsp:Transcript_37396/g.112055  ORF Transcript_37396/g.112055 Transcript_37396/m.112055 type:complete len:541 (-) Transcript_37396:1921-3543(-)